MKKKINIKLIIVLIISFILISKIYQIYIFLKSNDAIYNFLKNDNWYYCVRIKSEVELIYEEYFYDNVLMNIDKEFEEYGYNNFETKEKYYINQKYKRFSRVQMYDENYKELFNLPSNIIKIENKDIIEKSFMIYFIIPTNYNNKKALKIYTPNEIIIIDKENYLPIAMIRKLETTVGNDEFVNEYEFKINCVTEEDVRLPDLSEYEEIVQ